MNNSEKTSRTLSLGLISIKRILDLTGIKAIYFIWPVFLAIVSALFEGLSISLLLPLIQGIVALRFDSIANSRALKLVLDFFPGLLGGREATTFVLLTLAVFMTSAMKNVLQYFSSVNTCYRVREFSGNFRKLIFDRYLSFGMMFFDISNRGYLQNVLTGYTDYIAIQMISLNLSILHIFLIITYSVILFSISWRLTIFTILIIPMLFFCMEWLIIKIAKASDLRTTSLNILSMKIHNVLSCIPLVKMYTMEGEEKKLFNRTSDIVQELEFSIDKKQQLIFPFQDIITLIIVLLIISAAAWINIKMKIIGASSLLVYFYIVKRCASSISILNASRASLTMAISSSVDILHIIDNQDKLIISEGNKIFPGLKEAIRLNNLSYSYRKDAEVLHNISFSINKNEITAIVGPTGAGKTSIINLILRFYDCPKAMITIDGTDIHEFTTKSLRRHMALVSQSAFLFNDTLRNNIVYGLEGEISDDDLINVVKKARLYDFVIKLPQTLDTYVGDHGIQLSGGEKQRVSIARALLKGSEILLLDEATSALDTATERLIQDAIDEIFKSKTVIVIAHRLSTIKHANRIIVINDGRLVEEGTLNGLLEKKGKFSEYWDAQKFY